MSQCAKHDLLWPTGSTYYCVLEEGHTGPAQYDNGSGMAMVVVADPTAEAERDEARRALHGLRAATTALFDAAFLEDTPAIADAEEVLDAALAAAARIPNPDAP